MNKKVFAAAAALLALLSPGISFGQDIETSGDTLSLKEAVVTSLKIERLIDETPAILNIVTSLDVKQRSSFTVADVLKYQPGLAIGGDGVWATNINVRGLSENRLVTLVDGNRIETATDLTASLAMIDVNDIETLKYYVTDYGKILPARITGVTSAQQRQIRQGVKRARNMGLMA